MLSSVMNDQQIFELSDSVLASIVSALNQGEYAKTKGLTFAWGRTNSLNARAISNAAPESDPSHEIIIEAELVCQIYKDLIAFEQYISNGGHTEILKLWYPERSDSEFFSVAASDSARVKNMFIGAITWVFFHELGHLWQEHGYIRGQANGLTVVEIDELQDEIHGNSASLEEATVRHVTEIAADHFATQKCMVDLIRHFKADELAANIQLIICGISCVLYRFNRGRSYKLSDTPQGTHPQPLVRLEFILPMFHEFFDLETVRNQAELKESRKNLVTKSHISASIMGVFWNQESCFYPNLLQELLTKGVLNRPILVCYTRIIIAKWDKLKLLFDKACRFNCQSTFLFFTDEYRNLLNQYDHNHSDTE